MPTVDRAKAALAGIPSEEIVNTLHMALQGTRVGLVHMPQKRVLSTSCCVCLSPSERAWSIWVDSGAREWRRHRSTVGIAYD